MRAAAPEKVHGLERRAVAQRNIHVQCELRVTTQVHQLQRTPKAQENVPAAAAE